MGREAAPVAQGPAHDLVEHLVPDVLRYQHPPEKFGKTVAPYSISWMLRLSHHEK